MPFPDLKELEQNIINLLQPLQQSRTVWARAFPDNFNKGGIPMNGLGVILVATPRVNSTEPDNKQFGNQVQKLMITWELVVIHRTAGGGHKKLDHTFAYTTCKKIIDLLAGVRLVSGPEYGKLYFKDLYYTGLTEADSCWIYTIMLGMDYNYVAGDCCDEL